MRVVARHVLAVLLGLGAALLVLIVAEAAGLTPAHHTPRFRLVAEDASAPLERIAIHYAPAADPRAVPVWRQLFAVLPARVQVDVAVASEADFARFLAHLRAADV